MVERWRRLGRRWRLAIVVLLAMYAGYLFAANVFLGFHLLDRVVTSEDGTVELRTRRAWSLFPGHASARDVTVRIDTRDLQMRLTVVRAKTSVSLWRLFKREVRLSDIDAEGVSFRLRMRVESVSADNAERVEAFPEIEGALGPPLLSTAKNEPPTPVEKAWHVDLREVIAKADEIWINEYRVTGDIRAEGGFALWPGKEFVLAPSSTRVYGGRVRVGSREITRDFELAEGLATITAVPLATTHGVDLLRYLSASAKGTSTLLDASFLDLYAAFGAPYLRVKPSPSVFDAKFDAGRFVRGTTANIHVPGSTFRLLGVTIEGPLDARVDVPEDGDLAFISENGSASVQIDSLPSTKNHAWTAHGMNVRQVLHLVVGEPVVPTTGTYAGEMRTPTLGWFVDTSKLDVTTQGASSTTFDLKRDEQGHIRGSWKSRIAEGVVVAKDVTARMAGTANGEVVIEPNPAEGVTLTDVHIDAPNATVHAKGGSAHTTWLRAEVPSCSIAFRPHFSSKVSVEINAGNAGLAFGMIEAQSLFLGAISAKLVAAPVMKIRLAVTAVGPDLAIDVPYSRVGLVDAKAFWLQHHEKGHGALLLQNTPFSVGVIFGGPIPLVIPAVGESWLASQR